MSEDCCALNADGTLKDASEITFFNDPDDKVPLPQVASSAQPSSSTTSAKDAFSVLLKAGCTPATVAAGSRRSGRPSKPSARICDADNACGLSSSTNRRKRALSSATDHPAPKKTAMRILSPLDSEDEDIPSTPDLGESSADELIPQPEDDDEVDESKSPSNSLFPAYILD
ncbi:uncharacterized protein F5147DRAFT_774255 [Suillus discolor]|uniref:Uncharacterized protein n=1 Tax=Suillus discolor TaxID=1912936 RepID=A0A9P7F788_9AGAM|nr:uncharacterized protein F5147DRAFT_774255 [Suillus discolor]KAG2107425.1 hypothetical protein F5147DRAFT_774255 [Suillus discolor]